MLLLELLQHIQFLLLVARRLSHLLLTLVIHHLLDHFPRLSIQVAQLAVLGLDLGGIDFWRCGDYMGPPLHLIYFVEMNADFFSVFDGFEGPCGFIDVDGVGEIALRRELVLTSRN